MHLQENFQKSSQTSPGTSQLLLQFLIPDLPPLLCNPPDKTISTLVFLSYLQLSLTISVLTYLPICNINLPPSSVQSPISDEDKKNLSTEVIYDTSVQGFRQDLYAKMKTMINDVSFF